MPGTRPTGLLLLGPEAQVRERNHYLKMARDCEDAAARAGPDEERSLLFMARRFHVLAEHASPDDDMAEPEADVLDVEEAGERRSDDVGRERFAG